MQQNDFLRSFGSIWGRTLLFGVFGAALSFFILIASVPRYQVSSDFLIVQTQTSSTQDAYSLFKSLDYLGKVLNESVYSERFIGAVVETGKVDTNFLPSDSYNRLKEWKQIVTVDRNADAGILHVIVKADDQKFALRVSQAVSDVLVQKNSLFRGGDDKSVEVRVLSGPIVEGNPSTKEIVLAAIGGFVVAILLVFLWIAIRLELNRQKLERKMTYATVPEQEPFYPVQDVPMFSQASAMGDQDILFKK